MKGILLLNGEPYRGEIEGGDRVVCCDGAYHWANGKVRIDENVGDFDSLDITPVPAPSEIYPTEKDFTDGEIGLYKLLSYGCDEIEIYGGGGGREDHFSGNLHLLYYAKTHGANVKMFTNHACIFPVTDRAEFVGQKGGTVSLFPFGGAAHIVGGAGFKYPLDDLTLSYGSCRGISNVIQSDLAFFTCNSGMALVFFNI